jgi:hypothetical protein
VAKAAGVSGDEGAVLSQFGGVVSDDARCVETHTDWLVAHVRGGLAQLPWAVTPLLGVLTHGAA